MSSTAERYWEVYDDQSSDEFSTLSYENLAGETVEVPTETDLETQVAEIRRVNGAATVIKVYR